MSLFVTSLNSGSNGNCYYVGNDREAVLVDAGITCREIEKRLKRLQLSLTKIKAVFVSHEHTDHIGGLAVLSKKYSLPVYITPATLSNSRLMIEKHLIMPLPMHRPVAIGSLLVTAFPKLHDAADPCSFLIGCREIKVGVFTDIGLPCAQVIRHFRQCHAAFLETNYDDQLLEKGSYPRHLKNRIRGERGHLSNHQALALFKVHKPPFMSHLFLSHLSKNNNCPKLVQELFSPFADETKIIVASRFEETPVYLIHNQNNREPVTDYQPPAMQLQFSFF